MAQDRRVHALVYFCSAGSDLLGAVPHWRLDMEFVDMTEQEWKAMLLEDKIAITNIVIGVVRKSGNMCSRPLRYPIRLTPEADLYVKEKKK